MTKYNFSILFVLAIASRGGGGNIVVWEAQEMRKLGADVYFYNLYKNKQRYEETYPDCTIPVIYGFELCNVERIGQYFDVVCATHNDSVQFFHKFFSYSSSPELAYYIQDYEPNFYDMETEREDMEIAHKSYTEIPGMVRFTKTKWNRDEIMSRCGVECTVTGPSVNLNIFSCHEDSLYENEPLKICAMVRHHTLRRSPELTMNVLRKIKQKYRKHVDIVIFGSDYDKSSNKFFDSYQDFEYQNLHIITSEEVAETLRRSDIFVDFSSFQAMGLTAMEAMASGCAVIVPQNGGASDYAKHGYNSLVVDTSSEKKCFEALDLLIQDEDKRRNLRENALSDIQQFSITKSAERILDLMRENLNEKAERDIHKGNKIFTDWLINEYIGTNENRYIYGAGKIARSITAILKVLGVEFKEYVVTDKENNPDYLEGHHVISYQELKGMNKNEIEILVALGGKNCKEVIPKLQKDGYAYHVLS